MIYSPLAKATRETKIFCMVCPYGSEPNLNAPSTTWLSYRDLLGCNGQPNEPYYCALMVDFPNLLALKDTSEFCAMPQPIDPGAPTTADYFTWDNVLAKLVQIAEHKAWSGLCHCKAPPPPDDNSTPYDKDFPVRIPASPECLGEAAFAYYVRHEIDKPDITITGFPEQALGYIAHPDGRGELTYSKGYYEQKSDTHTNSYDYVFGTKLLVSSELSPPISTPAFTLHIMIVLYNTSQLVDGFLKLKYSDESPIKLISNYLYPCPKNDNPPPPPGLPPPPDACCPTKPPDLSDIYQALQSLSERIDRIPPNPIIGNVSIESADNPFGVRVRRHTDT